MTQNISQATPQRFRFILDTLKNVTFWATGFTLPSVSINPVLVNAPPAAFKVSGDILNFGTLSLEIICDEDLLAYEEFFNWMNLCTDKRKLQNKLDEQTVGTLFVNTNKNKPNVAFKFFGVTPSDLGTITYSLDQNGTTTIKFTCEMNLDYFVIERVK